MLATGFASMDTVGAGQPDLTGLTPVFRPLDLAYVWALSIGLSVAAGLYPAWKASNLPPIVALKRE